MGNNSTTNNLEIDKYAYKNIPLYKGTWPFDKAPILKNNESCIINTDDSTKNGEHWMSLIKSKGKLYGYDSFGRKMNDLIKYKRIINDTDDREQKTIEKNCGPRSIAFLLCCHKFGVKKSLLI